MILRMANSEKTYKSSRPLQRGLSEGRGFQQAAWFGLRHSSMSAASAQSGIVVAGPSTSAGLRKADIGKYYPIDEGSIPEAFDQWYSNRDRRSSRSVPIDGGGAIQPLPAFAAGCTGLQHELALSRYPYLMYRYGFSSLCKSRPTANSLSR